MVDEPDRVALADLACREHAGVDAARTRMVLLGHPRDVAVGEALLDLEAGRGIAGHLDQDARAQLEARARRHALPVEALDGQVLADGARGDVVPFGPEDADLFYCKNAERALGAAVVLHVPVQVALESQLGDLRRRDGELGDSPW